jgi:hypothetical protein
MATRKMTFSLPEDLAKRLVKRVPARDRSGYLARLLEKDLRSEEETLKRSCLLANQDADAKLIEHEFDQIQDPIEEPWDDAPAR